MVRKIIVVGIRHYEDPFDMYVVILSITFNISYV